MMMDSPLTAGTTRLILCVDCRSLIIDEGYHGYTSSIRLRACRFRLLGATGAADPALEIDIEVTKYPLQAPPRSQVQFLERVVVRPLFAAAVPWSRMQPVVLSLLSDAQALVRNGQVFTSELVERHVSVCVVLDRRC
jgi:hypothetical protein